MKTCQGCNDPYAEDIVEILVEILVFALCDNCRNNGTEIKLPGILTREEMIVAEEDRVSGRQQQPFDGVFGEFRLAPIRR